MEILTKKSPDLAFCPICHDIYLDPLILPCGKYVCSECVPDQGMFECELCSQKHTKKSAVYNEILANIVAEYVNSDDQYSQNRNYKILRIRNLVKELKTISHLEHESTTHDYFSSVKNKIQLRTECVIESARNESQKLIDQVTECQEKTINELATKSEDRANQLVNLEKELDELLKSGRPRDQVSESLNSYLDVLIKQLNSEMMLNKSYLVFKESSSEVRLGSLALQNKPFVHEKLEKIDLTEFFRSNNIDPNAVSHVCLNYAYDNYFVLAYKPKNRYTIYLNIIDSKFKVIESNQVHHWMYYDDFQLFMFDCGILLLINYSDKFVILSFSIDSFEDVEAQVTKLNKDKLRNQSSHYRIYNLEIFDGSLYALCLVSSPLHPPYSVILRFDKAYLYMHTYEFKKELSFCYELNAINGMRVKNDKLWILDSTNAVVFTSCLKAVGPSNRISSHGLADKITNFPNIKDFKTDLNNFMIDSQENFIFLVGWPGKISRVLYVNLDGSIIFSQELNDLEIDHFFTDQNDNFYLVDVKQFIVYKLDDPCT